MGHLKFSRVLGAKWKIFKSKKNIFVCILLFTLVGQFRESFLILMDLNDRHYSNRNHPSTFITYLEMIIHRTNFFRLKIHLAVAKFHMLVK